MLKQTIGCCVAALSLAACATGSTVTVIPGAALSLASAPKSPDNIRVFQQEPPEGSYVPVAVIEATQAPLLPDDADAVLGKMIARAGQMGCDGLVLETQDQAIGTAGPHVTSGWNGLLAALPEDAYLAEVWFGSGHINPRPPGVSETAEDHWTLEGYRAECVVLR